ncbi:hypothetical protein GCM10009843_17720 [Nocardioides bigeumensis]|uniref:MFS transporter n=1 Tax=Nocardioides bigeumensis TaxID=433657 RepID=A0ABP5JTJ2_9ACTN
MSDVSARTGLAALEVWLLTVVAHSLAGGGIPSSAWLLVVGVLVLVGTACVMRLRVPIWVAAGAVAGAQLGLHVALTASAPASAAPMAGHVHPGHPMPMTAGGASLLDGLSTQMVLAHVLSALVTGFVWWLRRRTVEHVLRLVAPVGALVCRHAPRLPSRPRSRPHTRPWLLGDPGRAPPRALVAA